MKRSKNIILCNLQNSGSSALDPIFRELLVHYNYRILTLDEVSPNDDSKLLNYLNDEKPVYAWTHIPMSDSQKKIYHEISKMDNTLLLVLHRDPRDAIISNMHDLVKNEMLSKYEIKKLLSSLIQYSFREFVQSTVDLLEDASGTVIAIKFKDVKENIEKVLNKIFLHANVDVKLDHMRTFITKYSFENQTGGVQRGESDAMVLRNVYMYRKGTNGDWKIYFDDELIELYNASMRDLHKKLGYTQ
jgi:hypothetical protein